MTPTQAFVSALEAKGRKVRRAGKGYEAQCPNHSDRAASLSVAEGADGRVLLHCHAGCELGDILAAMGLELSDLFPPKNHPAPRRNGSNGRTKPAAKASPTLKGAIEKARRIVAEKMEIPPAEVVYVAHWLYPQADGAEFAAVVRINLPTPAGEKQEKTFRPFHAVAGGWAMGDPAGPWPLYRLPELLAAVKGGVRRVFVPEGEKACEAAVAVGLPATTSAHGAKAAAGTDWTLSAGVVEVVFLPDADEAGEAYAMEAAALVTAANPGVVVKAVRLADLAGDSFPKGGDFVEFANDFRDGQTADDIRNEVEAAADRAEVLKADASGLNVKPADELAGGAPVLTCMADVQSRQVEWLWFGRIPLGRLTLFVGLPGEGKSFCTTDMAARITTGEAWPDGAACPLGSVILICAEDDAGDTIRPRLDAHGADVRRVHLLSGVEWVNETGGRREVCFTLDNLAALEESLKRIPDCRLIVIDPIGSFLGGETDSHRDNEVRAVLAPVAKLAERYGPAVLIVAHRRKSAGTRADDLAIGSRAFTGIARACWHLSRDPENKDRRLFLPGKNNLAREGDGLAFSIGGSPPRLFWESSPVAMSADEGLAAENAGEDRPGPEPVARKAAENWLRELLAGGELGAGEVREQAKAAGLAWRTVQRAADDLEVVRFKAAFGGGWRWKRPPAPEDATKMPNPAKEKQLGILASSIKQAENDNSIRSLAQDAKLFSLGGKPVTFASGQDPSMRTAGGVE